ncbi:hypothetical protein ACFL0G_05780 [Candidatus Zixiibacteriota bacterium]
MPPNYRIAKNRLGDILGAQELIKTEQLEEALKIQKETGERLGEIFVCSRARSSGTMA